MSDAYEVVKNPELIDRKDLNKQIEMIKKDIEEIPDNSKFYLGLRRGLEKGLHLMEDL